jgi:hypothetical protein
MLSKPTIMRLAGMICGNEPFTCKSPILAAIADAPIASIMTASSGSKDKQPNCCLFPTS